MKNLDGVLVKLLVLGVLLCCNLVNSQNPDQQQQRQRRFRQDLGQVRRGGRGGQVGQVVGQGAQKRSDGKSSSSWPSSESLWSDIPKSDNFDLRNWRSWHKNNGDGDDDDHGEIPTSLQGNKQFKRNIPPPQLGNFNNFNNNDKVKPDFYPSAPISNPSFPKTTGYNPQQPQPYEDDEQPDFNYNVNYNEGDDDKHFQTNFPEQSFKKSPQVGSQHASFPSSSFTPSSFGGSGFPTSIDYNAEPQSNEPSGFYDEGNEGGPQGGARGQQDFDFTGHFGDPTDKDGRIKSPGVSQSYSTFTGPDGKSNGFFVKDHNNGALPAEQIKHQIESSISNLQGNLKPGSAVRGFNTNQQQPQRPTFEESEDDDEDESSASSFGGQRDSSSFGPPPSINFGDTERYKRGSQTQERFHKNDKNAGGKNTQKTFRQPLPKIQYNRPDPDTDSKTYDDSYGTVKTFKGGYSSDDKDAHLRPPPTYNYELIDDEDGEGKFEQPQGQENETFKQKNEPDEDYYIPKGQEEKVRPKYEEMAYEDKWRNRQDRKFKEKEGNDAAAEDEEAEGSEGREGGEAEGQGEEEEEEEEEAPVQEPSKADKNKRRQQQPNRGGQKNTGRKMTQRKRQLEVDNSDESKVTPTWIWDPAQFKFDS